MVKTKKHPVTFYEEVRISILRNLEEVRISILMESRKSLIKKHPRNLLRGSPNLDTEELSGQDQETPRNLFTLVLNTNSDFLVKGYGIFSILRHRDSATEIPTFSVVF